MSSPKAKGNPRDKVIFVWEKHTELTASFGSMWVMTESVPGLSGRTEQSVFWHKHRSGDLMEGCCEPVWPVWPSEVAPERYFAGQILSWACRYWLWVWSWQTDLKSFISREFFSGPPASSPCVIKEMLLHLSETETSEDTEKLHSPWAFACLHVNLMDNPSVLLSPFCVGLRGLFTMREPWVNEFIAHVVNRRRQRAFNKLHVLHEILCGGCFTRPFLSKVIACRHKKHSWSLFTYIHTITWAHAFGDHRKLSESDIHCIMAS